MPKPNVLIVYTDQQSLWTLSVYGGVPIETPHIDRIGREGAVCTNYLANSAVCTPSRGCFLTGRYPHCHGAYTNNLPLGPDEVTFARVLQEYGYDTGYAGKWHLDGTPRPGWVHPDRSMGFADCRYMFNRGHWKKIEDSSMGDVQPTVFPYHVMGDERTYTTDWLTAKTIEYLTRPRTRPFCFVLSIPDPHTPFRVREPYGSLFQPEDMAIPPSFHQESLPSWARNARESGPYAWGNPDREATLRRDKALYCGEVKLIDDCVGRLLGCLQDQGILERTIVVFTSDHGEYMGEHGLAGKNQLYETAYRVPLLIRWPAGIAQGTIVENMVGTVDFQPTLLGLMGFAPCGREQGRDASPLLRGERSDWKEEVFLHHSSHNRAGIFTPEFALAYVRDGEAVLFDRKNDPEQMSNLFLRPEYGNRIDELTARIIRHHEDLDSPAAPWLKSLRL